MKALIRCACSGTQDRNVGTLILRVYTGAAMMTHGWGKLFGGLDQFTGYVESLGLPMPGVLAFLAAFTESFGALFLLLGVKTRIWAALLGVTMFVAVFVAHANDPFATRELAVLYLAVSLFFVFKGGGRYSVDWLVKRVTRAE
ncbi:MAG: DoxX family protein [Candidatus Marinimicrobia bacterium]|nr:DoxX family protein [Candidatus Neomarinimicrobiota bacterium]